MGKKTARLFHRFALCAAVLCALFIVSCGKSASGNGARARSMMVQSAKSTAANTANFAAMDSVMEESALAAPMAAESPAASEGGVTPQERKIIYSANLRLEVRSLSQAKTMVEDWVKRYGGYVSNASEDETSAVITANIPSASFANALEECGTFGVLKGKDLYSTDVTERYYDLETRLSTRKVLLERLKTYLASAKNMQDMLQIETKINDVTSELERMQGQMNRLSTQIDFSQITVRLQLPVNQNDKGGFILPSVGTEARTFIGDAARFFVKFAFVALKIIIFGVPCVLFLMLLFWLTLGKVGLLRKLFARIKADKKESA